MSIDYCMKNIKEIRMVNQTEFVDHLRERMNEAIEKDLF